MGEAAASPGFSTAVSAFPAVLDSGVPIAFPSDKESQPIQKDANKDPTSAFVETHGSPLLSPALRTKEQRKSSPSNRSKSSEEQDFWKEQQKTGREREVIKSPLGGHRQAAKWRNFPRC